MPGIQYKQFLVPTDGSDSANRAAAFAANLAFCCEGQLTLLHVLPALETVAAPTASAAPSRATPTPEVVKVFRQARDAMLLMRRAMNSAGVQIEEQILHGDPAQAIIDYAQQHPEAMIVMGSRGLSRMRELLLGSVSDKVLRHAPCPVTVVP